VHALVSDDRHGTLAGHLAQGGEVIFGRGLLKQLQVIRPKLICALGAFAAQTLLKTEEKISSLRGKFHEYQGIPLMPTYHPAYLLRNPNRKREVWEDMKKIKREYDKL
jgi:DNA polymerase